MYGKIVQLIESRVGNETRRLENPQYMYAKDSCRSLWFRETLFLMQYSTSNFKRSFVLCSYPERRTQHRGTLQSRERSMSQSRFIVMLVCGYASIQVRHSPLAM